MSVIRGDGQATFSFFPATADGGATVTSFTVTCNTSPPTTPITISGPSSPLTMFGLTNGVNYICSVTATNSIGTSLPSSSVFFSPAVPVTLASAASRKNHAGIDRDLPIDTSQLIGGAVTVEPRAIGSSYSIVFNFSAPVTSAGTATCTDGVTSTPASAAWWAAPSS
jgi:hypothetical protein